MDFNGILSATDISASGLAAERYRMEVVANNIANAQSTRTSRGGPFRRQEVIFQAVLDEQARGVDKRYGGVQVVGVVDDPSEFQRVWNPDHPDADGQGFVLMPNVKLPIEMVNLITASRAYEANLRVLRAFTNMAERALSLLVRG